MQDDINDLYQELILDHNAHPHNYGELKGATHHALGQNPLCGDEIAVFLKIKDGQVEDVHFMGHGCAISKSSASMMTDALKGKSLDEAKALFEQFHTLLTSSSENKTHTLENLGKIAVFSGVKQFPARVKCATLAWHTVKAAIDGAAEPITTE